jgi:putative membrane protein
MDHGFGLHDIWGYWWLFMLFWWFGGMRMLGAISHRMRRARREDPALTTLRERFARGEIDRAEYEERRAVLRGRPQALAATAQKGDGPAWPDLP